jgi:hypothetical protein
MSARVRDVMTPGPIGVDYHQSIGEAPSAGPSPVPEDTSGMCYK